jgi:hypothetical protein
MLVINREADVLEQVEAIRGRREIRRTRRDEQPREQRDDSAREPEWRRAQALSAKINRGPVCYPTGPRPTRLSYGGCVPLRTGERP